MKRYILAIESLVNDFSLTDTYDKIKFEYKSNSNPDICGLLEPGDTVLLYRKSDINQINTEMVIVEKEDALVTMQKIVEVARGVDIVDDALKAEIIASTLVEICESLYQEIKGYLLNTNLCESTSNKIAFPKRKRRSNLSHDLNCIIYGAPGTGKTYSTVQYAVDVCNNEPTVFAPISEKTREEYKAKYDELVEQGRIVFTTFHQSYGYEDFIQGLRPDAKSESIKFVPVDGVFKKIVDKAMLDTENDYVIIIDEINRGNISKVFGELITLIEDDKRWGESNQLCIVLPSGQQFAVPNNLYIVGTMNSADKSISLIDAALRRRFQFEELSPNSALINDTTLKAISDKLNESLVKELDGTDLLIGHSYFIGKKATDLCQIMNRSIIPLLYEYFFDSSKKVRTILKMALDGFNVEIIDSSFSKIRIKDKE